MTWLDLAELGWSRPISARRGRARHGEVGTGKVRLDRPWLGKGSTNRSDTTFAAGHVIGSSGPGSSPLGAARRGKARQGLHRGGTWRDAARQDPARRDRDSTERSATSRVRGPSVHARPDMAGRRMARQGAAGRCEPGLVMACPGKASLGRARHGPQDDWQALRFKPEASTRGMARPGGSGRGPTWRDRPGPYRAGQAKEVTAAPAH